MNVLFASSEAWPLIKTGGLGDVAYSLPHALQKAGADVHVVLPAYREVLKQVSSVQIRGWLDFSLAGKDYNVRVLKARHKKFQMPLWLIDCQNLFDRDGGPYIHMEGYDWPDNAERFSVFSLAVARLAMDDLKTGWKADVVHSNDWQTGMVSVFLDQEIDRPRRVFTVHNMAYGGYFSHEEFTRLHLPAHWWSAEGVEFYGNFSMLKAGLIYSDAITTVSPTYAEEICTASFGYGMEGVLSSRRYKLSGILNGIDSEVWDPATDPLLPYHYSVQRRNPGKKNNKQALLENFGLIPEPGSEKATENGKQINNLEAPLFGMVSRLVEQKGVDMVIDAIPSMLKNTDANFILMGKGHPHYEAQLLQLSERYPQRVRILIGYSEEMAHRVEAGSDLFLMPSRFEPCGLNQLYSLRYGTLPIVHRTGGLADTVSDGVTGFVFNTPITAELVQAMHRAIAVYADKKIWNQMQRMAMQQDFGWEKSARQYLQLYTNPA